MPIPEIEMAPSLPYGPRKQIAIETQHIERQAVTGLGQKVSWNHTYAEHVDWPMLVPDYFPAGSGVLKLEEITPHSPGLVVSFSVE